MRTPPALCICAGRTHHVSLPAVLALADGTIFRGQSIGAKGNTTGEVVFNTALTGLPGNSHRSLVRPADRHAHLSAHRQHRYDARGSGVGADLLPRASSSATCRCIASNWRANESLPEFLERGRLVAIAGIDTRKLTRLLREKGAQSGCIMTGEQVDEAAAVKLARKFPGLKGMDLAKVVSAKKSLSSGTRARIWPETGRAPIRANQRLHVVAYDFGIKRNILRLLADGGCRMTVVPAQTPAEEVLALEPDGVFLSNGPGDPEPCDYAIAATRACWRPICRCSASAWATRSWDSPAGAKTVKMKFGHHGANHPVQDLESGRVMITSQNHGFAVDEATPAATPARPTHRSLFDGSLQGLAFNDRPAFSFQGHPEASPGPHDVKPLFERFNQLDAASPAGAAAAGGRTRCASAPAAAEPTCPSAPTSRAS